MAVQEGLKILMQRHGLGVATLDDVLIALLDGAKAIISAGECKAAVSAKLHSCLVLSLASGNTYTCMMHDVILYLCVYLIVSAISLFERLTCLPSRAPRSEACN